MNPIRTILASTVALAFVACTQTTGTANETQASTVLDWNRIALEAIERGKPTQHQVVRLLAHLSIAQHVVATELPAGEAGHRAMATASRRVIAGMMPAQAAFVDDRYRAAHATEDARGVAIAARVLAEAANDRFAQPWTGTLPQGDGAWRSLVTPPAPPAYPAIGGMQTFFMERGAQFRAGPPPSAGSARFTQDLAEVRQNTTAPTAETTRSAKFYDMTTGTLAGGFWNEQATVLARQAAMNGRTATTMLATLNGAMMDALVACHDTKYTYWVPRPSQAEPTIRPLIGVPNHPAYPSNHSCLSTAAAHVLAHFFPGERKRLEGIGEEAGVSRIHAGLHYRFDVTAGEEIGRKVASLAIAKHPQMLAQRTRTVVGGL